MMISRTITSISALFAFVLLAADDPAVSKKYQVVTPKDDGIIATAINDKGHIAGFEWVEDKKDKGVINQDPILARGKTVITLPVLKGYTATFPAGLSDDGVVVGRASKPMRPGVRIFLQNQAFVWDEKGGIRGLGALKDDFGSFASAITRDGRRIAGLSVGENRIRPCIWDRDGESWKLSALPVVTRLTSQSVAMSDDGKHVAATDGPNPCLWTQSPTGEWTREVIGDKGSMIPRGVNRAGMVVGVHLTDDGLTHAVIWTRDVGMKTLEKPKGYVKSEAMGVNNAGVVVGMIDGPHGSDTGPNGFVYEGGKLRILTEGGPNFGSATAINDQGQITGTMEKPENELRKEEPAK